MSDRVLIVDDEEAMRDIIASALSTEGFESETAPNISVAKKQLREKKFDVLITDLNMPGGNGIELVQAVRRRYPSMNIIVVTAFPDQDRIRMMEELEVDAFLIKPFTISQIRFTCMGVRERRRRQTEHGRLVKETEKNNDLGLVGASNYIRRLRKEILLMAAGDFPVLVQGESGTGKEVVANAIHQCSRRGNEQLVTINCGAIPRHLEESEFFGHVKGAFTGAHVSKQGILESAHGSTVFLDEIGELSLNVQAKLLRVLDSGEFIRVGETSPRRADIRVVSATNRDLLKMVEEGRFRKDLYFRLRGASICTEPLSEHPEDIPLLAQHFTRLMGHSKVFLPDALDILTRQTWHGNIRELKHAVDLLCSASLDRKKIGGDTVRDLLKVEAGSPANLPFSEAKVNFERDYFAHALQRNEGNVSRVAREVGLYRPNLIRKLRELGLDADQFRSHNVRSVS